MKLLAAIVLLHIFLRSSCTGQTFQYSRGWTNGKRSDIAPAPPRASDQLLTANEYKY